MPKDPLCPLGFHPQVRWPTRCKRCFREYKEHTVKKDEPVDRVSILRKSSTEESPSSTNLQAKDYSSPYSSISPAALNRLNRIRPEESTKTLGFSGADTLLSPPEFGSPLRRNTTDLSEFLEAEKKAVSEDPNSPSYLLPSSVDTSFTLKLKKSSSFNEDSSDDKSGSHSPSPPPRSKTPTPVPTFKLNEETNTNDKSNSASPSPKKKLSSTDSSTPDNLLTPTTKKKIKKKRLLIQEVKEVTPQASEDSTDHLNSPDGMDNSSSADVAFIIQVKSTRKNKLDDEDTMSFTTARTDTTDTTLVDVNESSNSGLSLWEFDEMKKEVDRLREKCDKLEKEKADILGRRVSSLEAPKVQSTEYLKLQQRVNLLATTNEDLRDEQKHLEVKVRELESELGNRPTGDFYQRQISELRSKLLNSEAEIEKLHEEKRETLQQMNDLQDEFEEMQDSFHEDQSEEFASLKKELDDANKNCRVLQFKLRKVEKKVDTLDAEKKELEMRLETSQTLDKITELEQQLARTKAENEKLLKENKNKKDPQLSPRSGLKKKSPVLTKAPSGEAVDPPISGDVDSAQLLRDLQSTVERESDLREQLKFAEEEVTSLRKKISRIEDENESLLIQIKKISTKGKPEFGKGKESIKKEGMGLGLGVPLSLQTSTEKLDANELKLQLELNEQESKILRRKVEDLEIKNNKLGKDLQEADEKLQSIEKENKVSVTKSKNIEEVSVLRRKIIEKEREVERLQSELQSYRSKGKVNRAKSVERIESDLKAEIKKTQEELLKLQEETSNEKQIMKEEIEKSRKDIETYQHRINQLNESNKTLLGHIEKFKKDISTMKEHYEAIQDEFVIKNANLQTEKDKMDRNYVNLRKEYDTIDKELRTLRETFNDRQDTWIKEKLAMKESLGKMEQRLSREISGSDRGESTKIENLLKHQTMETDGLRKELGSYKDQIMFMQKENDELRKQLEDFEKLSQAQIRSISNEPTVKSDKEIKLMKERLQSEEKAHKTEIAQMKLRYEQEVASRAEELSAMQAQLSRAKRERDTFRQMVDSAQRAIAELKSRDATNRRESISGLEEAATGARAAVNSLQERIQALEDELTDSRKETARSKTELATEKSAWELKLSELQQKINELEEDKLLSSARGRAVGQKTRLELAWQKEREEQQRRLKEATTLARDLKTTLQEIEREKDREKMEGKRRLEQLKSALEEEQEELRRKVSESQCDLLELRDAHAKLRTANEKLRRDREKLEKEKETQLRKELEVRKISADRDRVLDELINRLNPTTTSPQPNLGTKVNMSEIVQYLQNLRKMTPDTNNEGLQRDRRRSSFKKAASIEGGELASIPDNLTISSSAYGNEHYGVAGAVRAASKKYAGASSSTLTLPSSSSSATRSRQVGPPDTNGHRIRGRSVDKSAQNIPSSQQGNLFRKSLSLEQNVSMPDEQRIWKGESEAGSGSSLKSITSVDSRGSSIDRFSTISSKSEKPKSKSLVSKVKSLVKSRSIEESSTAESLVRAGVQAAGVASNSGSVSSLTSETDSRGRDTTKIKLKDKVKGIFRRSSRSPSVDRSKTAQPQPPEPPARPSRENTPKRESTQRPLMPTESSQRPLMPSSSQF